MTVAARPKKKSTDDFIGAGGDTPAKAKSTQSKDKAIPIRLPVELLERLDTHIKTSGRKISRNAWVIDAILEKLNTSEA
ncbi:MAG: hypothetical protein HOM14_15640 [Gammaproteobacteria bacterium]|jgi:hypothetical protein|nr:hypothetical protein [Gammaproteobacteria bacterium]MBT6552780.1 hypothetical protein [Gammaproteobacteria bacterium]